MNKNNLAIPLSIVVAGALIAGALYFGEKKSNPSVAVNNGQQQAQQASDIRPVDKTDHIEGNPDAKVKVVEYSDLQCPYCQDFDATRKQVMDNYGKDGKVAWVYRQYPLYQIHPYAEKAAEASECVAELGGNDKFWAFLTNIFSDAKTQASKIQTTASMADVAAAIGIDKDKFSSCVDSGKYSAKIQSDLAEGRAVGVNGTPTSFIVVDGKTVAEIPGDLSYADLKANLDTVVK